MRLYDILLEQNREGPTPFAMPGHMQSGDFDCLGSAAAVDFTEIDGLDNLHAPEGILRDAMARAARRFGAERCFFLVNGSTVGVLAAIWAAAGPGGRRGTVLSARNAHRSVWNALMLTGSPIRTVTPRTHPLGFALDVTPGEVEAALDGIPDPAAVVVTSPTYDGVVSDVAGIAKVCHRRGVPLLVDAAHGAHLGFLDPAVPNPVACGADAVVMSLHKTLPSLTQTALLHVSGSRIDPDAVAEALTIFETSSPSYPLMASIDGCVDAMGDPGLFTAWHDRLVRIRESVPQPFSFASPRGCFAFDESKLILSAEGAEGRDLTRFLRSRGIEPEMTSLRYTLLLTGAGLGDDAVGKLCRALQELPEAFPGREPISEAPGTAPDITPGTAPDTGKPPQTERVLSIREAAARPRVSRSLADAEGEIAAESVTPYPPGIPLLLPGERITRAALDAIRACRQAGIAVLGARGAVTDTVAVCGEEAAR